MKYGRDRDMEQSEQSPTTNNDAQLLAQLREFDSDALTCVYNRYHGPLYRYISFHVNNPQTVEDLTSEVFTRLLSAIQKGQLPTESLKAWLFRVASNVVNSHHRQGSRWKWTALTEFLASSAESVDQQIARMMNIESLREQLKHLTELQQHVLALRYGYGLSIREVAELLGRTEGAIKMTQARAVATLARKMTE